MRASRRPSKVARSPLCNGLCQGPGSSVHSCVSPSCLSLVLQRTRQRKDLPGLTPAGSSLRDGDYIRHRHLCRGVGRLVGGCTVIVHVPCELAFLFSPSSFRERIFSLLSKEAFVDTLRSLPPRIPLAKTPKLFYVVWIFPACGVFSWFLKLTQ